MNEYMKDSQGRMVPVDLVPEIDKLRDETVRTITAKALGMQERLRKLKVEMLDDINAFVDLSAEKYGVKLGGKKGNITLSSYDGEYKVLLAVNEYIQFDERLQVAKELIDQCIKNWSTGARSEIRALVNDAFYVDKGGKLNTARILGLRRLDIQDPTWKKAMDAITESINVAGSKEYVRVYRRGKNDEYHQISLDMAAL